MAQAAGNGSGLETRKEPEGRICWPTFPFCTWTLCMGLGIVCVWGGYLAVIMGGYPFFCLLPGRSCAPLPSAPWEVWHAE